MKFISRIIFGISFVIIQLLSLPASSMNNVDTQFPWQDAKIQVVRCLSAKKGMVMLYLQFDSPLLPKEFNNRDYALVKWVKENSREAEFNEHLRGTKGILPGFGFNVEDFNLAKLLPTWPEQELKDLIRSINRMAGDCTKIVDINSFILCGKHSANTTIIVMPFMTLMNLEDFIDNFGASDNLVKLVNKHLSPTFDHMMQQGIVHGDLALRNVGVTFNKCGPFADYKAAFAAINKIVLYDFGSQKTRFLQAHEEYPHNETLNYLLDKITNKISKKLPRSSSRSRSMSFTSEQNRSRDPSPIKLLQNQERKIGPLYAYYDDTSDRLRKRKKESNQDTNPSQLYK